MTVNARNKKRKKSVSVTNNTFQVFTSNFTADLTRKDTMEGKEYLVVPMVMMVEGVHQGSSGPLYYPDEELSKIPEIWNAKPVVVYHPEANGYSVSACSPEILTNRKIGVIMNTTYEDGKLKAEAWLDMDRIDGVDDRILPAIENNEMMELSTGLFTDIQDTEGEWEGEEYEGIAINYRPDHLAVLPDKIGACSMADGGGFLRLNITDDKTVIDITTMADDKGVKRFLVDNTEFVVRGVARFIDNEMSFDDTRQLLYSKLEASADKNDYPYILDVFDDYFIYESNGGLLKRNYTIKKGIVSFDGLPMAVKKEVNYVSVNERKVDMDKKKLVDSIIANEGTLWKEADKEVLMSMEESVLNKMIPVENEESAEEEAAEETAAEDETVQNEQVQVAEEKPVTLKEYIEKAPKEMQAVLTNGLRTYEAEKKRLINVIMANDASTFTEDQLKAKDADELNIISNLMGSNKVLNPEPVNALDLSFLGQAEVINNEDLGEPLALPKSTVEVTD